MLVEVGGEGGVRGWCYFFHFMLSMIVGLVGLSRYI